MKNEFITPLLSRKNQLLMRLKRTELEIQNKNVINNKGEKT